jgi:hypothetical protein
MMVQYIKYFRFDFIVDILPNINPFILFDILDKIKSKCIANHKQPNKNNLRYNKSLKGITINKLSFLV